MDDVINWIRSPDFDWTNFNIQAYAQLHNCTWAQVTIIASEVHKRAKEEVKHLRTAPRVSTTCPPATGPSAMAPSATGPSAAGPSATGPSASGPRATEPTVAEAMEFFNAEDEDELLDKLLTMTIDLRGIPCRGEKRKRREVEE